MSDERTVTEVQTPSGVFWIKPPVNEDEAAALRASDKLIPVMLQQAAKYHGRRLPLAHARHLLAEYSVKPDFPP